MSPSIKEQLAGLQAELATRQQQAAKALGRKQELTANISRLRALQALDGADYSERLSQAQEELSGLEQQLSTWADVEAELQRRLTETQAEVTRQEHQALFDEYRQVLANEKAMRQQFKEKALELVYYGRRLNARLERKQVLRKALEPLRQAQVIRSIPDIGDIDLPPLSRSWMYTDEGVRQAIGELSQA